jgi:hypothetical protein
MGRRIIGLTGYSQVGKDTVAGILKEEGYRRLAFADSIRAVLYATNPIVPDGDHDFVRLQNLVDRIGWERAKVENAEVRRLLQQSGQMQRILVADDIWIRATFRDLRLSRSYVVSDVRLPNEVDAIRERGGEVWRVVRPGVGPVNGHLTETALDGYTAVDYTVVNDGSLVDLEHRVRWGLTRPPGTTAIDAVRRADDAAAHFTGGPARYDVV